MKCAIKEMAILQEAKNVQKLGPDKVRFTAKLQYMDTYSYNRKSYLSGPMKKAIKNRSKDIQMNALLGELDHPMDPTMMRMLSVMYSRSSHIFKEIYTEGNTVFGVLENSSTKQGKNLYGLIVKDKVPVGFSLRALGDTRETNKGKEVYNNIDLITWDCVSTPGFSGCVVQEITDVKHLESFRLRNDIANLEEFVNGDNTFRNRMLMESKVTRPMSKLVSKIENRCLYETSNELITSIRSLLSYETKKKIFLL